MDNQVLLDKIFNIVEQEKKPKKQKRVLSDEHKQKLRDRLKMMREKKEKLRLERKQKDDANNASPIKAVVKTPEKTKVPTPTPQQDERVDDRSERVEEVVQKPKEEFKHEPIEIDEEDDFEYPPFLLRRRR